MGARALVRGDLDRQTLAALQADGLVACDIETSGLDPLRERIGTVQVFSRSVGAIVVQLDTSRSPSNLISLIEDESVVKVFHHAPFDLRFIVAHWDVSPRNVACTKIASKLVRRDAAPEEHSLKHLLQVRLGIAIDKGSRRSDWLAADLTVEQLAYACADVEHLLDLFQVLLEDIDTLKLGGLYESCLRHLPARVSMDLGGWKDVFLY